MALQDLKINYNLLICIHNGHTHTHSHPSTSSRCRSNSAWFPRSGTYSAWECHGRNLPRSIGHPQHHPAKSLHSSYSWCDPQQSRQRRHARSFHLPVDRSRRRYRSNLVPLHHHAERIDVVG